VVLSTNPGTLQECWEEVQALVETYLNDCLQSFNAEARLEGGLGGLCSGVFQILGTKAFRQELHTPLAKTSLPCCIEVEDADTATPLVLCLNNAGMKEL
jgi:hypothetical protein